MYIHFIQQLDDAIAYMVGKELYILLQNIDLYLKERKNYILTQSVTLLEQLCTV